jgi:hypothetical protein
MSWSRRSRPEGGDDVARPWNVRTARECDDAPDVLPALPVEGQGDDRHFTGCEEGKLKSWVSFVDAAEEGDAFYGYNAEPGRTEDFWILDVDGTRLMIEANWSPDSPRKDVAEMRAILDSIRIEP